MSKNAWHFEVVTWYPKKLKKSKLGCTRKVRGELLSHFADYHVRLWLWGSSIRRFLWIHYKATGGRVEVGVVRSHPEVKVYRRAVRMHRYSVHAGFFVARRKGYITQKTEINAEHRSYVAVYHWVRCDYVKGRVESREFKLLVTPVKHLQEKKYTYLLIVNYWPLIFIAS